MKARWKTLKKQTRKGRVVLASRFVDTKDFKRVYDILGVIEKEDRSSKDPKAVVRV